MQWSTFFRLALLPQRVLHLVEPMAIALPASAQKCRCGGWPALRRGGGWADDLSKPFELCVALLRAHSCSRLQGLLVVDHDGSARPEPGLPSVWDQPQRQQGLPQKYREPAAPDRHPLVKLSL